MRLTVHPEMEGFWGNPPVRGVGTTIEVKILAQVSRFSFATRANSVRTRVRALSKSARAEPSD